MWSVPSTRGVLGVCGVDTAADGVDVPVALWALCNTRRFSALPVTPTALGGAAPVPRDDVFGVPALGDHGRVCAVPLRVFGVDGTFCAAVRVRGVCMGAGEGGTCARTAFCGVWCCGCAVWVLAVLLARGLRPGFAGATTARDVLFLGMG